VEVSLILVQGAEADPQAVDGGSVTDRTKMFHEDSAFVRVASCSMTFNIGNWRESFGFRVGDAAALS
jgi:hypothetical protein